MYLSILHSSLIISNTNVSLTFYKNTLGFKVANNRPNLGYPGVWLDIGEQQIHLLEVPNPDSTKNRPIHGGRDRHVAIGITDLGELISVLEKNDIHFTLSSSGRKALFCRDPDGNALEFIQHTV